VNVDGQYNLEHEAAVLAAVKFDNSAFDRVNLKPSDFYSSEYRELFRIIGQIIESGRTADNLTIYDEIKKTGSKVSASAIAKLEPVSSANVSYYSDSVLELSRNRRISGLIPLIQDGLKEKSFREVVEDIERELTSFFTGRTNELKKISEILPGAIEQIEAAYRAPGVLRGVTSGFKQIDKLTQGFQAGDLIIIGARPSIGKTSLALNMATRISVKHSTSVGFFSCEMENKQLVNRIIAAEGKINLTGIRSGIIRESDFSRITSVCAKLYLSQLIIDDTPNISLAQLKSKSRQMKRMGCQIIFVDYLTLVRYDKPQVPRHERVGEISKSLKSLARELEIPIVALSQVGRSAEGRMPTLADLRQSGEIEEDADLIMLLHRERNQQDTRVCVAKNRNGATDTISLAFLPQYVCFETLISKASEEVVER